jgi:CD109 antigen
MAKNCIFRMYLLHFRFDGKATTRKVVPDTITSWVISGFSVDPLFGLGLSEAPRKV